MTQEPYSEWLDPVPDEEREYYQHIETYFGQRGGFPWIIRGRDWVTARTWWEEKIPLAVIYDAIDAYFEKYGADEAPRFLGYVEPFVRRAWKTHRMAALGALARDPARPPGRAEINAWFENWQTALARAAAEAQRRGWAEVHAILQKKQKSLTRIQRQFAQASAIDALFLEELEQKLETFAQRLLREVRRALPAAVRDSIEDEVRRDLAQRLVTRKDEDLPRRVVRERARQKLVHLLKLPKFSVLPLLHAYLVQQRSEAGAGDPGS